MLTQLKKGGAERLHPNSNAQITQNAHRSRSCAVCPAELGRAVLQHAEERSPRRNPLRQDRRELPWLHRHHVHPPLGPSFVNMTQLPASSTLFDWFGHNSLLQIRIWYKVEHFQLIGDVLNIFNRLPRRHFQSFNHMQSLTDWFLHLHSIGNVPNESCGGGSLGVVLETGVN